MIKSTEQGHHNEKKVITNSNFRDRAQAVHSHQIQQTSQLNISYDYELK